MRLGRICVATLTAVLPLSAAADIVVNRSSGRDYHHLALDLSAGAMLPGEGDLAYTFSEGGLFEIYVQPELMGVAHPGCSAVTVRMPWSNETAQGAAEKIAGKRALFDRIEAVRAGTEDRVAVVLELDPYFETVDGASRLTQCTVFFRHAFGAYVDHAGPLN